jgi:hypothetical protein
MSNVLLGSTGLTFTLLTDGVFLDGQFPGGSVIKIFQSHNQLMNHILPWRWSRREEKNKNIPIKVCLNCLSLKHSDTC